MFSFGGQAIYTTYLNLYLAGVGLSQSQIGMTVSVSTLFALLTQIFWGIASDRAKYKNTVISLMFLSCSFVVLMFYISDAYWFILLAIIMFTCFQNGIGPIQDSIVLEASEGQKWNYGQIRAGGTAGYCITVLLIGFVIGGQYARIFYLASITMFACFVISTRIPRIRGHRSGKGEKTPVRILLRNKPLLAVIVFYLIFYMGLNFFYGFYPIYFTSIGGNSGQIGVMMFFCAITEIPCLMIASRIVKRFGLDKVLIFASIITCVRWALLFFLKSPWLVILVSMLHGPGYVGFTYGIVTFINSRVPKDLRATGQSFNVLVGNVFSKLIFGYLGGVASETLGVNYTMLAACVLLLIAIGFFAMWSSRHHEDYI